MNDASAPQAPWVGGGSYPHAVKPPELPTTVRKHKSFRMCCVKSSLVTLMHIISVANSHSQCPTCGHLCRCHPRHTQREAPQQTWLVDQESLSNRERMNEDTCCGVWNCFQNTLLLSDTAMYTCQTCCCHCWPAFILPPDSHGCAPTFTSSVIFFSWLLQMGLLLLDAAMGGGWWVVGPAAACVQTLTKKTCRRQWIDELDLWLCLPPTRAADPPHADSIGWL